MHCTPATSARLRSPASAEGASAHNVLRDIVRRRLRARALVGLCGALTLSACGDLAQPLEPAMDAALHSSLSAATLRFADEFDAFDETVWARGSHRLGRGPLMPALVTVADGTLSLGVRRDGFEGSEIRTHERWTYGTFSAVGRCAAPAGTLCTLFMYQTGVGDRADEIDIEILSGTRDIWFTIWIAGRQVNHVARRLSFDPAAGFNSYTIDRTANEIRFIVNGVLLHSFRHASRNKLPQSSMPLFANAWWPTWLTPGAGDGAWDIDRIEIR
jgi:endo-1,3-1,4-beta-glycanase ExoK